MAGRHLADELRHLICILNNNRAGLLQESRADLVTRFVVETIAEIGARIGPTLLLKPNSTIGLPMKQPICIEAFCVVRLCELELLRVISTALLIGLPVTRSVCRSIRQSPAD